VCDEETRDFNLVDRAAGPRQGAVTLSGDAAHAMLPFAAQGTGMAIEVRQDWIYDWRA
jgi:2-polyprenyl-6-methoxyphenol hydroxylase-like FAD-dependent oxidoreductase